MSIFKNKSTPALILKLAAISALYIVVYILSVSMDVNTYRRTLIPIIWQMCIFILLGTSLNLTLGYLGQLTLGHMGFAGIGAYTAALTSLALERSGVFTAKEASAPELIAVISAAACWGRFLRASSALSWAYRRCGCGAII